MSKYLKNINGVWNLVEEEPIVSKLLSSYRDIDVSDYSDEASPRFSISGNFFAKNQYTNDKVKAINEYNFLYSEVELSKENTEIWETRIWVSRDFNDDKTMAQLGIEVLKTEKPDAILFFSTSKTESILEEIVCEANLIALNKKYDDVLPDYMKQKLRVKDFYYTLASDYKHPIIKIEAEALKVDIQIELDLFLDSIKVLYHYNNSLPREEKYNAYEIFSEIKEELLGQNLDTKSVLNNLRIHSFIENQEQWNNSLFVRKLLALINPILLQNLK